MRRLALALVLVSASRADAIGVRLRADAVGQAQAPTGVLTLGADSVLRAGLTAEAMVWVGGGDLVSPEGDALVAALVYRDPEGRGLARAGRFVLATGALMPVQLDGAHVLARAGWGGTLELFAGLPVVPRFGERDFDWLVGGRVAQPIGPGTIGVAYAQRRDAGQLSDHTLGLDAQLAPVSGFDASARVAADLVMLGISEATLAAGLDLGALRLDVLASHRSPSRLLPATSLFSVLGDVAARRLWGRARWAAFPRLDLVADGGARLFDADVHPEGGVGAVLRLDDRGGSSISIDLRRQGAPDGGWTGARVAARAALADAWRVALELELVAPDSSDRGALWPWGLAALTWLPHESWELAAAFEARAGADERSIDGLLRAAYRWGGP